MEQNRRKQRQMTARHVSPGACKAPCNPRPSVAPIRPRNRDGKEGVDGSSPSEGSKVPANRPFLLSVRRGSHAPQPARP